MQYKITKPCECCHQLFTSYIYKERRFCSKRCAQLKDKKTVTCEYCHKTFNCHTRLNRRYCSKECFYEARKEAHRKTFTCQYCNREFIKVIYPSKVKNEKYLYCSPNCRNKARGFSDSHFRSYGDGWKSQWHKARQRDNNRCQVCGLEHNWALRQIVDVHHIIPIRQFNGDYAKANHLDNLVSLCRKCHRALEKRSRAN